MTERNMTGQALIAVISQGKAGDSPDWPMTPALKSSGPPIRRFHSGAKFST